MQRRETAIADWESVASAAWSSRSTRDPSRIIGVDCDGVLASDRLLWQHLRKQFPEHIPAAYEDLHTFNWPRASPETQALCQELSADRNFILRLAPIPRMGDALNWLYNHSYAIHVITARPACVLGATRRWLRMHSVSEYVEEIHCVECAAAKIPLARELGCATFVEDNHATAEAMGLAGIQSYLLDAPYNRMPNVCSRRMHGWPELLQDLEPAKTWLSGVYRGGSLEYTPAVTKMRSDR
ncbi:MAG: 5' nucleotidase, NT5C type [Ktedonobacterales bacterium]